MIIKYIACCGHLYCIGYQIIHLVKNAYYINDHKVQLLWRPLKYRRLNCIRPHIIHKWFLMPPSYHSSHHIISYDRWLIFAFLSPLTPQECYCMSKWGLAFQVKLHPGAPSKSNIEIIHSDMGVVMFSIHLYDITAIYSNSLREI